MLSRRAHAAADIVVIALFVAALWLPLLRTLTAKPKALSVQENRLLAPLPRLPRNPAAAAAFPSQFEAFFNDGFGGRDLLIRALAKIKFHALGTSPSATVLIGKDGWLYSADRTVIDHYRATDLFRPAELDRWQRELKGRRDWLAARGIRYLLVIVPEKHSIYPENLPRFVNRVGKVTRTDQFVSRLRADSNLALLDLRGPLREAHAREQVYYRKDTHWNNVGAFVGYQEILGRVAEWFPAARPWPRSAFDGSIEPATAFDLERILGTDHGRGEDEWVLKLRQPGPAYGVKVTYELPESFRHLNSPQAAECATPHLPRAVMFHDSFGVYLMNFLSQHFRRIVFEWQDYPTFDIATIEHEKPDIVIQEMAEFKLMTDVPADLSAEPNARWIMAAPSPMAPPL
jgi:hypothetical protein